MQTNKSVKKALLKKILTSKKSGKTLKGSSPLKLDNGLGSTPLATKDITGGNGSNLGTRRVF